MDEKTVSLIIPVYNVRDYLRKCLDSVAAQTYPHLEVVIVNDGSTDDSLDIIREYTAKYPNFRCYTIENRGQGGARNYGMEQAAGDYVAFLDSDDYIAENCIERLMAAAEETDCDMVVCNCYDVREDGSVLQVYQNRYRNAITNVAQEPEILFNRVSPWGKLYKRELLNGLSFASRVWYEDMRMAPKVLLRAGKVAFIEDFLFFYVQREGSTMNNKNMKRNLEVIAAFEDLLSYFREQGAYDTYRDALEFLVIEHIAVAGISRVAVCRGPERRQVLSKMQEYLGTFPNLYDNPYLPAQDTNRKIVLWCNRHHWYWATKLLLNAKRMFRK